MFELVPFEIWSRCADGRYEPLNRAARASGRDVPAVVVERANARFVVVRSGERGTEMLAVPTTENGFLVFVASEGGGSTAVLRELYGLTPAEARVAVSLANGRTARETAQTFSISLHTVRSHIKSILGKTSCRSQNELVARINRGVASLNVRPTFTQLSDSQFEA